MEKIKNVMIVGLGALGTLYADAVENTEGRDLYVLVDKDRKERYEKEGRYFRGEKVDYKYITPEDKIGDGEPADLIMICTKSNGMYEAVDMIENFVGEETIIMSLMNGVTVEELLNDKYGVEHTIYAIYLGDGVKNMEGNVEDVGKNRIFYGSLGNPRDDEQVELIRELFEATGIESGIMDDMLYAYWRKFVLIDSYNETCALFGEPYGMMFRAPDALKFVDKLIMECIPIAKAAGVENAEDLLEDLKTVADKIVPECTPSITQDRLMKRRMEVDILADETIRRADKLGLEVPYHRAVSDLLHIANKLNGFED